MRHWLCLTIALAGALAPGTVLAQDEDEEASDQGSKKEGKGADKKGAKSDEGGDKGDGDKGDGEAKSEADAEAEAKAKAELEVADDPSLDFDNDDEPKPKKKKGKGKPPPPPDDEVDGLGVSAGLLVGWGFQYFYHLAAGLRVGLDIGDIYVGGTLLYAFGQTQEFESKIADMTVKKSGSFILGGAEVGYNVDLDDFDLRPFLGLGVAGTPREECNPACVSKTGLHAYLSPGLTFLYPIDPVFIGLDARYNVVLGLTDGSGAQMAGTVGLAF